MDRKNRHEEGVALLLTLMLITLIVALTMQFSTSMRHHLMMARSLQESIKFNYFAKSGFQVGLAVLHQDVLENDHDTLLEDWAKIDVLLGEHAVALDQGGVDVQIFDLSGRFQINGLVPADGNHGPISYDLKQSDFFMRLLSAEDFNLDLEQINQITAAIIDWIDDDGENITTMIGTQVGAELAYYQGLEEPYSCRNGPIHSLEELLLVRGVTEELFYGSAERRGLADYLTATVGLLEERGKININTAPLLLLKNISAEIDWQTVKEIDEYRREKNNDLSSFSWYKSVRGDITIDEDLLTTSSAFFEIVSTGHYGNRKGVVRGIVSRKKDADNKSYVQLLSRKIE